MQNGITIASVLVSRRRKSCGDATGNLGSMLSDKLFHCAEFWD